MKIEYPRDTTKYGEHPGGGIKAGQEGEKTVGEYWYEYDTYEICGEKLGPDLVYKVRTRTGTLTLHCERDAMNAAWNAMKEEASLDY